MAQKNIVYQTSAPAALEQEETWKYGAPLTEKQRHRLYEYRKWTEQEREKEQRVQRDAARWKLRQLHESGVRREQDMLRDLNPVTTAATLSPAGLYTAVAGETVKAGQHMRETGEPDPAFLAMVAMAAATRGKAKAGTTAGRRALTESAMAEARRGTAMRKLADMQMRFKMQGFGKNAQHSAEAQIAATRGKAKAGTTAGRRALTESAMAEARRGTAMRKLADMQMRFKMQGFGKNAQYSAEAQIAADKPWQEMHDQIMKTEKDMRLAAYRARREVIKKNQEISKTVNRDIDTAIRDAEASAWDSGNVWLAPNRASPSAVRGGKGVLQGDPDTVFARANEVPYDPEYARSLARFRIPRVLQEGTKFRKALGWGALATTVGTAGAAMWAARRAEGETRQQTKEITADKEKQDAAIANLDGMLKAYGSPEAVSTALSDLPSYVKYHNQVLYDFGTNYMNAATGGNRADLRSRVESNVEELKYRLLSTNAARVRHFEEELAARGAVNPLSQLAPAFLDRHDSNLELAAKRKADEDKNAGGAR